MAKQRNIGSGVVAAARGVSAVQGRFQDVGEQFMTGYNKALESKRKKEAENKATQDRVNSYMDGFNNDIDLIKFKPEEQTLVKNKIASWRNEYADFANRAAAIKDKSSAEYQELIDNMNGIQNRMVNLKNNLDQLAAFKTEYSANIKAGTYSNAGANDMSLAQGEIMLQYPIGSIGDDGNLMWSDEGTGDFNFQDYQMPFEKATGLATALGKIANPIRMQKTPLDNLQKEEIREQVDNLTRNPKALASLISDSDLPAFDFSNIDPDDPNAREKVVDLLVNSIYNLRGKGLTPSDTDNPNNLYSRYKKPETVQAMIQAQEDAKAEGVLIGAQEPPNLYEDIANYNLKEENVKKVKGSSAKIFKFGPNDNPDQIRIKLDPITKKWVYFNSKTAVKSEYNNLSEVMNAHPGLFYISNQ